MQACLLGYVLEMLPINISKKRRIPITIDKYIFSSIVVEVAPHRSHRDSITFAIEISESYSPGNFFERPVPVVSIQRVVLTEMTVREVKIRPSIAVEVGDGDRCSERGDVRLDVRDFWI